jgi:outer membrane murein-binding lipoprotein Lpp
MSDTPRSRVPEPQLIQELRELRESCLHAARSIRNTNPGMPNAGADQQEGWALLCSRTIDELERLASVRPQLEEKKEFSAQPNGSAAPERQDLRDQTATSDVQTPATKDIETDIEAWIRAALMKDRTRRAIRERHAAGESYNSLVEDFHVPVKFVIALCIWQFGADSGTMTEPEMLEELRMGHVRLDECSDGVETKGLPLYDRISAKIHKLAFENGELRHRLEAAEARLEAARAETKAAEHDAIAAEYRSQASVARPLPEGAAEPQAQEKETK